MGIASVETSFAAMLVYGFTPSGFELATGLEGVPTWKQVLAETANGATDTTTSTKIADNSAENSHLEESMIMAAAGDCQTLTLSTTGRVYFFGCYKDVEGKAWRDLTPPDDVRVHPRPEKRNGDAAPCGKQLWPIHVWNMPGKVLHIDCGCSFNAAIVEMPFRETTNRVCVTWGLGETGELARPVRKGLKNSDYTFKDGDGPYAPYHVDWVREDYVVPQPVVWEEEPKEGYKRVVEFVACGGYHLLVIARDVRVQDDENDAFANSEPVVYGSGLNQYGQLGLGMTKNVEKLTRVSMYCMHRFVSLSFVSFFFLLLLLLLLLIHPSTSPFPYSTNQDQSTGWTQNRKNSRRNTPHTLPRRIRTKPLRLWTRRLGTAGYHHHTSRRWTLFLDSPHHFHPFFLLLQNWNHPTHHCRHWLWRKSQLSPHRIGTSLLVGIWRYGSLGTWTG